MKLYRFVNTYWYDSWEMLVVIAEDREQAIDFFCQGTGKKRSTIAQSGNSSDEDKFYITEHEIENGLVLDMI